MYVGFRVKCPLLLPEFNETCIYLEILKKKKKYSKIKFHENPSSVNRVIAYGQTDRQFRTIALRNFANALKEVKD